MTPERFQEVVDSQIKLCKQVLDSRAESYSADDDRLHNFKQAAYLNVVLPEDSLFGMVSKQIVALSDEIHLADCREDISVLRSTEYITDIINYMLLLKALITETHDEV